MCQVYKQCNDTVCRCQARLEPGVQFALAASLYDATFSPLFQSLGIASEIVIYGPLLPCHYIGIVSSDFKTRTWSGFMLRAQLAVVIQCLSSTAFVSWMQHFMCRVAFVYRVHG